MDLRTVYLCSFTVIFDDPAQLNYMGGKCFAIDPDVHFKAMTDN